jgi:hypothetical protein
MTNIMIAALAIALWWIAGVLSFAGIGWQGLRTFTWGDLLRCVALGLILGPTIWLLIAVVLLVRADFWTKPIFGK